VLFCCLNRKPARCASRQAPNHPCAGAGKQTQFSLARVLTDEDEHLFRIVAGQPLRLVHALSSFPAPRAPADGPPSGIVLTVTAAGQPPTVPPSSPRRARGRAAPVKNP